MTSAHISGSKTIQADHFSGYEPWVVGVATGIPSFLALVLAIILAVVCVLQRKNYSWNQTNQHCDGQEEHEYESSPPRPPDDFYMTMMRGTTDIYINEAQDKHHKPDIQTQAKPMRTKQPRKEPSVVESIYENHSPYH
ncbi:hypothetical protein AV530_015914 [Patagioenas fasciata monilis]|uniref:Uncharacterized protein n=1 Tax=Patagioenas fasciata monilis TaxID=372326 RepID=A0A1V4KJ73_PATFA|nr:hypothetical protein AV530_015914 [Patagioenas fasciata monilis]